MGEQLLSALNTISKANLEILNQFQGHPHFEGARKNLRAVKKEIFKVELIFQCLQKSLSHIKDFVSQSPSTAVSIPAWEKEDYRFSDIRSATGKYPTLLHKFRAHLAFRSLALEFEDWNQTHKHRSRVESLASDLSTAKSKKLGSVTNFIQEKGYPPQAAKNAISYGVKVLVLEKLSGTRGISVLLAFTHTQFKDLRYNLLQAFADELFENVTNDEESFSPTARTPSTLQNKNNEQGGSSEEVRELRSIALNCSSFIDDCQETYHRKV